MKKLIIAALLVAGMTTYAQEKKETPNRAKMERMTPEERQERQVKRLTSELTLTAQQQATNRENPMDRKELSKEEMKARREASRTKMQEDRKMMEDKLKGILTPAQFTTYKANQEKMREQNEMRMKDRMGTRNEN